MSAASTLVGTPVVAPVKAVRAVRSTRVVAAGTKTVSKPKAKVPFSPVFLSTWQLFSVEGARGVARGVASIASGSAEGSREPMVTSYRGFARSPRPAIARVIPRKRARAAPPKIFRRSRASAPRDLRTIDIEQPLPPPELR